MTDPFDQLKIILKQHGQSLTVPRQTVFKALQAQEPQTMSQIVASCSTIDRASVYRSIDLFEKLNIIQRLQVGWKYKIELTDDFHRHHHHLTCRNCHAVITFKEEAALEAKFSRLARQNGFKMESHQLEIQGLCRNCT